MRAHYINLILLLVVVTQAPILPIPTAHGANKNGYQTVDTKQFTRMMEQKDFLLVNVHIPYQGEIPGTDIAIPFNRIKQAVNLLPKDKNSPIVVYCMGSYMGKVAAKSLSGMGYTRVTHFYNGMMGWQNNGGELVLKR